MGRNILFVTTDQQRYDALGCNGGTIARTPTSRPPATLAATWTAPLPVEAPA